MITFTINDIGTKISRFQDSLHIETKNLSMMVPSTDLRWTEVENTKDKDVKLHLLNVSDGAIEIKLFVPTELVADISSL